MNGRKNVVTDDDTLLEDQIEDFSVYDDHDDFDDLEFFKNTIKEIDSNYFNH